MLDASTTNHMRVLTMPRSSLFLHGWMSDNTVADIDDVSRKTGWLVGEARGSLLGKVGYRTPEVSSGGVSRKAGCRGKLPR